MDSISKCLPCRRAGFSSRWFLSLHLPSRVRPLCTVILCPVTTLVTAEAQQACHLPPGISILPSSSSCFYFPSLCSVFVLTSGSRKRCPLRISPFLQWAMDRRLAPAHLLQAVERWELPLAHLSSQFLQGSTKADVATRRCCQPPRDPRGCRAESP